MQDTKLLESFSKLTSQLLCYANSKNAEGNAVISTASLMNALGMALSGAEGETAEEIRKLFGEDINTDETLDFIKELNSNLKASRDAQIKNSNVVIAEKNFAKTIKEGFSQDVSELFNAEILKAGANATDDINNWVLENTEGQIADFIKDLPDDFKLALINALMFEAKWEEKYEERQIREKNHFSNMDGTTSEVTMIQSGEDFFVQDKYYRGFIKPYKGNKYSLMALLPNKEGKEYFDKALKQLDIETLYESKQEDSVFVLMPEFDCQNSINLNGFLEGLGMKKTFTDEANFSKISDKKIKLDSVIQKVKVKFDREGVIAIAVSALNIEVGCANICLECKEIILNRPFVYAVIDNETGIPIFAGTIENL